MNIFGANVELNRRYTKIYCGSRIPAGCVDFLLGFLDNNGVMLAPVNDSEAVSNEFVLFKKDSEGVLTSDVVCRVSFAVLKEHKIINNDASTRITFSTPGPCT